MSDIPRFYRVGLGGKIIGPFEVEILVGWARAGTLSPHDQVLRHGGSMKWITAKDDPDILEACKDVPGWRPSWRSED